MSWTAPAVGNRSSDGVDLADTVDTGCGHEPASCDGPQHGVSEGGISVTFHSVMNAVQIEPVPYIDTDRRLKVLVEELKPGDSPRLRGLDQEHVRVLAELDAEFPPLLVDPQTMAVIDGMHRLSAARMRGQRTIDIVFSTRDSADSFLLAVEANARHGLPLSSADRRAAALRIFTTHAHLSDRAIAKSVGLGTRTVALLRRQSQGPDCPAARIGADGRARPVDRFIGRARVAELLAQNPQASSRELARLAGVSPSTARDVRRRFDDGETLGGETALTGGVPRRPEPVNAKSALQSLMRDPSLRDKQHGRRLLRMLQLCAVAEDEWSELLGVVPGHCSLVVRELAQECGKALLSFASDLRERADG